MRGTCGKGRVPIWIFNCKLLDKHFIPNFDENSLYDVLKWFQIIIISAPLNYSNLVNKCWDSLNQSISGNIFTSWRPIAKLPDLS